MKFYQFFTLFILLSLSFSCQKKGTHAADDDPYQYKEYISYAPTEYLSTAKPVQIVLAQPLTQFETDGEIPAKYFKIAPDIKGTLYLREGNILSFEPTKRLRQDTEYRVSVRLGELFSDIDKELSVYTFSFKTLKQNFKINLGELQSYDKEKQYLEGVLQSADYIESEKLPQLLQAKQGGKNLTIQWDSLTTNSTYYKFKIDHIARQAENSNILISWNGKAIDTENKGQEEFLIPGYDNFQIIAVNTKYTPTSSLTVNFSDPLDPNQDFSGLVSIEKTTQLNYEVDGNVLHVYPENRIQGQLKVTIHSGIKNTEGKRLKEEFSELLSFEQPKPAVELISKGVILPNSDATPIYFKTVNLSAVDVRIIKIYNNNILQFLQQENLNGVNEYNLKRVGKRVAKKTINLHISEGDRSVWKANAIKLSDFFKADPGALYQVEFSFKPAYSTYSCEQGELSLSEEDYDEDEDSREESYWNNESYSWRNQIWDWEHRDDPCYPVYYQSDHFVSTNLLGSDLGIIIKKGTNNSYRFFTTNLLSSEPETNTTLRLYNYQQQLITSLQTDSEGAAQFESDKAVAFVIAEKNKNFAYAKTEDGNALSMSKFDIAGSQLQKGLKGFIYTDRGVHRPGDKVHLTFVLDDRDNPLPEDVPIKLEVENARGKIVQRTISSNGTSNETTRGLHRFYYFPVETKDTDETGNWYAKISVGGATFGKTIRIATVKPNRLKIKLDFDDEILHTTRSISGLMTGTWLHGAIARNLKAEMDVVLSNDYDAFDNYQNYTFTDPVRKFDQVELPLIKTALSQEGTTRFSKEIKIDQKAPGMLKATFLTKLFEGGGDFSLDVYTKQMAPYDYFVGIQSPDPKDYGNFYTDEDNNFQVITLNTEGKPVGNRKLRVQIFEVDWYWWWYRGEDNLSKYEDATIHRPFQDFELTSNPQGKASFNVNIPDDRRGRYLIRVKDENSGHATGAITYFFKNWWGDGAMNADNAQMLVFSSDKKQYTVGETAKVTFPSGTAGNALISIENGTEVISAQWVKTQKGETSVEIPITPEMAPNVYVNISLLQPHQQTKNDLPIRLFGVIPIKVENPQTILKPKIDMPSSLKPEESYTIKVSEQNKRPMTYTIAVVDEGLLDLTRFQTPDIHNAFYSRQSLGVKTFDIYDYVIGAYSGSVNNIYEIGGDDAAQNGKKNKANRFEPVVSYLGPFELKPGETRTHQLTMPNYVGSVRAMVIAGDTKKSAYGSAEKTTPVKKPLMVLASLPRKLSPGETVTLPVTVFAMENKIKNVKVNVTTSDAFTPLTGTSQTIRFTEPDEKIVNFTYRVNPTDDVQTFVVNVSGNGEKASTEIEMDVENPNPYSHKITSYKIENNGSLNIAYEPFGVAGTNAVKLEVSTLPPINFNRRMQYLIHYPHGCVEQTTSAAFPQLFLDEIFDLTQDRKAKIKENVQATIQRIGDAQLPNGGLPFWPGEAEAHDWNTSYAGHFMLEAKEKGYVLPVSFLDNWLLYQKNRARQWNIREYYYNSSLQQAYRLYTLALAGQPELTAMNRLRESSELTNEGKWRLAAAYALTGKKEVARQILESATTHFKPYEYDYYNFGSPFRNQAMALETMVLLKDERQRNLVESMAGQLSQDYWMSTQETSYGLLAMAKMIRANGGKAIHLSVEQDGQTTVLQTDKPIAEQEIKADNKPNSIKLVNHRDNLVYVNLYQEGKPEIGKEQPGAKNLTAIVRFVNNEGQNIDISKVKQGTEIEAQITVTNTSDQLINDVALTQIFPSGWEIINTSYTDLGSDQNQEARYTDIRDDRTHFYFDLHPRHKKTFSVKLNASFLGRYYLPGTYAEGMYNHDFYVQTKGQWVEIEP